MKDTTISEIHQKVERHSVKGFLARDEAEALWRWTTEVAVLGPCLEIGSYCGKSTVYIGSACQAAGSALFAVDHHRGSEEHQRGEEYHDAAMYDASRQVFDTWPEFQKNMALFELEDTVVPIVTHSELLARHWATPLALAFIDGGHSHAMAKNDCLNWSKHLLPGGILAIHDIFPVPHDGGQGPYFALQAVLAEGSFEWLTTVNSLGILRRK